MVSLCGAPGPRAPPQTDAEDPVLYVADSEFEADCKKVIAVLTKWRERHGDEFMAPWRVSHAVGWAEKRIEEVRESLVA